MKKRKKTPTQIIEESQNPSLESAYLKVPKKLLELSEKRDPFKVTWRESAVRNKKKSNKYYGILHTHSAQNKKFKKYNWKSLPSSDDFTSFLEEDNYRTMGIAERNPKTGKVLGYTLIRKTKKTPKDISSKELSDNLKIYNFDRVLQRKPSSNYSSKFSKLLQRFNLIKKANLTSSGERFTERKDDYHKEALDKFCREYDLQYRNFPNKFYSKSQQGKLEGISATLMIVGFIGLLFTFTFPKITGNSISNLYYLDNSIYIVFLLIGLIGILINFKLNLNKKKRNE
ncbi:hypothetical protein CMI40_02450 [Candidatus Pacearchaeota archaeon]|nr:hypothetical protein [Candidatus Pacearchaeota archaeon]|tara:strand:- start:16 stop:870 length:855 start_codon:yes stop_codon:yes gene_type:complete